MATCRPGGVESPPGEGAGQGPRGNSQAIATLAGGPRFHRRARAASISEVARGRTATVAEALGGCREPAHQKRARHEARRKINRPTDSPRAFFQKILAAFPAPRRTV